MTNLERQTPSQLASTGDAKAIEHLEQAIKSGRHWYPAMLEAIGMWTQSEEVYSGRTYRYVIAGEALDWLLLAERLCQAVESLIPKSAQAALLFNGQPPLDLPREKFKELIGAGKYRQYLNYFYGVVVEEALFLAVQEEVRKEKSASGYSAERDNINEAYRRIYDVTKGVLLKHFRQEKGYPQVEAISLTEMKEFTYWLFKYRLKRSDKAKVASDTKKALEWLKRNGFKRPDGFHSESEPLGMLPPTENM